MNISGQVIGDDRLVFKLQSLPNRLRKELATSMKRVALQLVGYVQKNKLSGQVLNVKTGTLRRSIRGVVTENEHSITALVDSRAGGGAPVVYAAIHEYGGIIRMKARSQTIYHRLSGGEVKPRFVKKSKSNFARNVDVAAHSITMPMRSYLRTSLAENQGMIEQEVNAAVKKTTHE